LAALFIALTTMSSCALLPRSGPTRNEILSGSVRRDGDAFVVGVDARITAVTSFVPALGFSSALISAGNTNVDIIRPGDVLFFQIYENVNDGLFADEGRAAGVDGLEVTSEGTIFIPYVGQIVAAGRTVEDLRQDITRRLSEQTPDPQVILRREAGDGAAVLIEGPAAASQGVIPLSRTTRRLSGLLAESGGITAPADTTQITLVRNGMRGTVWYQDILRDPRIDIALRPGDRVIVEADSRSFTALGATASQRRVPFDSQIITAIEAIASVGGLNPNAADPTGVFVLRIEPEELARAVLQRNDIIGAQRMIYVLDLTEPNGLFEARDFVIRDEDIVYVTAAPITQFNTAISALTGTLNGVTGLTNASNATSLTNF
jgi:polysaccharide export outer membrane protein